MIRFANILLAAALCSRLRNAPSRQCRHQRPRPSTEHGAAVSRPDEDRAAPIGHGGDEWQVMNRDDLPPPACSTTTAAHRDPPGVSSIGTGADRPARRRAGVGATWAWQGTGTVEVDSAPKTSPRAHTVEFDYVPAPIWCIRNLEPTAGTGDYIRDITIVPRTGSISSPPASCSTPTGWR